MGLHRGTRVSRNQRLCSPLEIAGQKTTELGRGWYRTRAGEGDYRRGSRADNDAKVSESTASAKRVFEDALAVVLSANSSPRPFHKSDEDKWCCRCWDVGMRKRGGVGWILEGLAWRLAPFLGFEVRG
jgi:hypothetical protein